MFFIPAYPFWSLTIIAVDVVAVTLWGLCMYGSHQNLGYVAIAGIVAGVQIDYSGVLL
jgi:hypothetical protein